MNESQPCADDLPANVECTGTVMVGDDLRHSHQVTGQSGTYIVEWDAETGETVRDDRPWQMSIF